MGRNGSGKSTLIKAGLGLISAENGSVRWEGTTVRPRLRRLARRGLYYLPSTSSLSRRLRVGEQWEALQSRFDADVALLARDPMGVADLFGRRIRELSGGERRRVELTFALARSPACLIADEPFIGLAPKHQEVFADEVRGLAGRGGAVLITGHEVDRLFATADDVIWIVAGGTFGLGTPDEARQHQQFRREYLGSRR